MEYAAHSGHLDVVQWLYENRPEVCTVDAIDTAAREGHVDLVVWLHKRTGDVCSDRTLEYAALGGHLEMVCWLEKNTRQRAAGWGFAEATQRGYLEVMRMWLERTYGIGRNLGLWEQIAMRKCTTKILKQLSQAGYSLTSASGCDDTTCQFLTTLERYHSDGFRMCANVMLQSALEVGYIVLVQRFFEKKTDRELEKYVEIAADCYQWALLRWLLENGAQLTTQAANHLMKRGAHVEVTWWLSESDRVKMVCKTLREDSSKLLLWLLENTKFVQKSSRKAIREAIYAASDDIRHSLMSKITDASFRAWCLNEDLDVEVQAR